MRSYDDDWQTSPAPLLFLGFFFCLAGLSFSSIDIVAIHVYGFDFGDDDDDDA